MWAEVPDVLQKAAHRGLSACGLGVTLQRSQADPWCHQHRAVSGACASPGSDSQDGAETSHRIARGAYACLLSHPVVSCQAPLSMEFSRQGYWSGLQFPTLVDLPDPGTEPTSPESPALAGEFFATEPPGKPARGAEPSIAVSTLYFFFFLFFF